MSTLACCWHFALRQSGARSVVDSTPRVETVLINFHLTSPTINIMFYVLSSNLSLCCASFESYQCCMMNLKEKRAEFYAFASFIMLHKQKGTEKVSFYQNVSFPPIEKECDKQLIYCYVVFMLLWLRQRRGVKRDMFPMKCERNK